MVPGEETRAVKDKYTLQPISSHKFYMFYISYAVFLLRLMYLSPSFSFSHASFFWVWEPPEYHPQHNPRTQLPDSPSSAGTKSSRLRHLGRGLCLYKESWVWLRPWDSWLASAQGNIPPANSLPVCCPSSHLQSWECLVLVLKLPGYEEASYCFLPLLYPVSFFSIPAGPSGEGGEKTWRYHLSWKMILCPTFSFSQILTPEASLT